MKKIILAYSGGLDTSYCLKKLSIDNEVHAVNINTGGYTIEETNKIKEKAIRLGAYSFTSIDAVDSFYNRIIKYPNAKIFGITTGLPVMKINYQLGYKPVTFSELTSDEEFWKGCQTCKNYDVLNRTNKSMCLCTGMLYEPKNKL